MKKKKHALVICNGEMPSRALIAPFLRSKPFILCADGGANKIRSFGITPHCIIGDLDSITQKTRHFFSTVPIIHVPDQNSTDLEKSLDFLLQKKYTAATIIGAIGDRPDHTLANFSILVKYHKKILLQFIDEYCTAAIINKRIRFAAEIGQQISLVPMSRCRGITTTGLKYPLTNESLEIGIREGTSNEAVKSTVSIAVRTGSLLLFVVHSSVTA